MKNSIFLRKNKLSLRWICKMVWDFGLMTCYSTYTIQTPHPVFLLLFEGENLKHHAKNSEVDFNQQKKSYLICLTILLSEYSYNSLILI